ncbi:decapping and exoribonuclease protein-like [Haemaphysalis longicornis]
MALSESVGGGGDPSVQALRKCPVPGDYIASLCVRDAVNNSDGKFPSFREPREIGNFSLVGERREFVEGAVQMKYLRMPSHRHRLMWDLNVGFETAVRRDRSVNERLDSLLRWILRNRDKFALSSTGRPPSAETPPPPLENKSLHTDFVCYRGLLTRLACTAYEAKEDWRVAACRHRGTVYLCAFETDAERQRRLDEEACPRRQRMSYWGYKFEQYMVSAEPGGAPDPEAVLNECEEYCVVVRSRLESHSLVFGAEVDAVDPRSTHHRHSSGGNKEAAAASTQPGSTAAYVELKTSRDCLSEQQYRNFCRFKLLKWWAQSFLVGIPRVVCGFRDDNGLIGTLEEFDVREMTHRAKGMWSGAVCMNFCNRLLSFIKKHAAQDDPGVVYLFQYLPESKEIVCTHLSDPGEYFVLPDWYLQAFEDAT